GAHRPVQGHLRGLGHHRLPDGSLPPDHRGRRRAAPGRRAEAGRDHVDDDRGAQLPPDVSGRSQRRAELRGLIMRSIKTTTGTAIALDNDLLAILETLFHEVTAKRELERSFEDMRTEIEHLVSQMTDEERRAYLAESLFLNQVTYENDKLESYMRKLEKK